MKRRNLCNTKKLMAVILAASMVMSSGATVFAEQDSDYASANANDYYEDRTNAKDEDKTDVNRVEATSHDFDSDDRAATATVTVGNVKKENGGSGVYASSTADSNDGNNNAVSTTDVSITGKVDVQGDYSATGVKAGASSRGYGSKSSAITTVEVGKDVTVVSKGDGEAVGLEAKTNVELSNGSGSASVSAHVEGSVSAESKGSSTGIKVSAEKFFSSESSNASGTVSVTVDKDVNASTSQGAAAGINLGKIDSGSTAEVTVGGDINAVSKDTSENTVSTAKGIVAYQGIDGTADVKVVGDINATNKNGYAEGIMLESAVSGTLNIDVGGSVTQDGSDGWAIALPDSTDGMITITVGDDVKATNTAVNIIDGGETSGGIVDLTVKGEISGGEYNIALGKNASLDDVNITVWKVDTSENKAVVVKDKTDYTSYDAAMAELDAAHEWAEKNDDYSKLEKMTYPTKPDPKYEQDTEAEKKVNYIIHVQSDVSIAKGTRKVNGYDTARQDETVTFAVTVPSGYEIENFFNVSPGHIISLDKGSADGTYLLTVPRGGGVDIGVTMKKIQNDAQSTTTNQSGVQAQIASTSSDNSKKHESDETTGTTGVQNWSVGNYSDANAAATMQAIQGLQVHALNLGGAEMVQNVADVLTPVDTITALNNFSANNVSTLGTNNIMGTGVVDFKSMFLTAVTDTVDVPVAASVAEGQSYTVMFSDGTSVVVQCLANGVLNIPFNKNAEGLTYIIYGLQMDPSMFLGMPVTSEWTY